MSKKYFYRYREARKAEKEDKERGRKESKERGTKGVEKERWKMVINAQRQELEKRKNRETYLAKIFLQLFNVRNQ